MARSWQCVPRCPIMSLKPPRVMPRGGKLEWEQILDLEHPDPLHFPWQELFNSQPGGEGGRESIECGTAGWAGMELSHTGTSPCPQGHQPLTPEEMGIPGKAAGWEWMGLQGAAAPGPLSHPHRSLGLNCDFLGLSTPLRAFPWALVCRL